MFVTRMVQENTMDMMQGETSQSVPLRRENVTNIVMTVLPVSHPLKIRQEVWHILPMMHLDV